jgi:hypothetical protein
MAKINRGFSSNFSYGEVHDYSAMGFELGGDIDDGDCAIR